MDTIYFLFQSIVKENYDRTAIIENTRSMTFGELSNMVDMIAGTFPEKVDSIGIVLPMCWKMAHIPSAIR